MPGFYPRPFLDSVMHMVALDPAPATPLSQIVAYVKSNPDWAHFTPLEITSAIFVWFRDNKYDEYLVLDMPY
jgi:hypothetical protein